MQLQEGHRALDLLWFRTQLSRGFSDPTSVNISERKQEHADRNMPIKYVHEMTCKVGGWFDACMPSISASWRAQQTDKQSRALTATTLEGLHYSFLTTRSKGPLVVLLFCSWPDPRRSRMWYCIPSRESRSFLFSNSFANISGCLLLDKIPRISCTIVKWGRITAMHAVAYIKHDRLGQAGQEDREHHARQPCWIPLAVHSRASARGAGM